MLSFLFPQWCVGCGRGGDLLCPSCLGSLAPVFPPLCPLCGTPQASGVLCPNCVSSSAAIDGIRSPFRFEGVMRQAVYELKYGNLRTLALPLARLLKNYLDANPLPVDALVPVPLHKKRLRGRGYNQSLLLARKLGRLCGLPVVSDCLVRERHSLPQARTSGVSERQSNVSGAFACCDRRFQGRKVLLIDDVATSGATLNACAVALKAGGAASVWGLTLAKEI